MARGPGSVRGLVALARPTLVMTHDEK